MLYFILKTNSLLRGSGSSISCCCTVTGCRGRVLVSASRPSRPPTSGALPACDPSQTRAYRARTACPA
eukprot:scaffold121473_cov27-Phaeocystis_antarctica.AAC.1